VDVTQQSHSLKSNSQRISSLRASAKEHSLIKIPSILLQDPTRCSKEQAIDEGIWMTMQFRNNEDIHRDGYEPKRRDRYDIMAEILENARGGVIKTHIMFKARLSYAQMNEYIRLLQQKGYLETVTVVRRRKIKTVLKTSSHGEEFLRYFRVLKV
jgi:predicted transcriptional regulator